MFLAPLAAAVASLRILLAVSVAAFWIAGCLAAVVTSWLVTPAATIGVQPTPTVQPTVTVQPSVTVQPTVNVQPTGYKNSSRLQ